MTDKSDATIFDAPVPPDQEVYLSAANHDGSRCQLFAFHQGEVEFLSDRLLIPLEVRDSNGNILTLSLYVNLDYLRARLAELD